MDADGDVYVSELSILKARTSSLVKQGIPLLARPENSEENWRKSRKAQVKRHFSSES